MTNALTLQDRLTATDNRPSGFDYMRLTLALLVIASHTINVCYGPAANFAYWSTPARIPFAMILPMFFALSGFLVAGSLERCKTLISFLGLRLFRLVPALAVETTLSALILGPFFTVYPLGRYFAGPEFRSYFLNMVGNIHYALPGVFPHLPWPAVVNLQLWTLPYELGCYAAITALTLSTIVRRRFVFLLFVIGLEMAQFGYHTFIKPEPEGITSGGFALIVSFLFGVAFYLYRDRIRWDARLFWAALLVTVALALRHSTSYLIVFPATYLTVYLGLMAPPRINLLLSGDYSYGLFLYGFPIQQAVSALLPQYRFWWVNLLISIPAAWAIAAVSWWCVENPVNRRRKVVFKAEAALLRWFGRSPVLITAPTTAP